MALEYFCINKLQPCNLAGVSDCQLLDL